MLLSGFGFWLLGGLLLLLVIDSYTCNATTYFELKVVVLQLVFLCAGFEGVHLVWLLVDLAEDAGCDDGGGDESQGD